MSNVGNTLYVMSFTSLGPMGVGGGWGVPMSHVDYKKG